MKEQEVRSEAQAHANAAGQAVYILKRGKKWRSSVIKHDGWRNEGTVFPEAPDLEPEVNVFEGAEETIYTGSGSTLMHLQIELESAFKAAKEARHQEDSTLLDEDEVDIDFTLFMDQQTLTDGSKVYNLRIV